MNGSVLVILGTRPEAIKLAPVIRRLKDGIGSAGRVWVCSTGQHQELLEPVLELFRIEPDVRLDVMRPDQSLPALASLLLERLGPVLEETRPRLVLVQGDTTTAFIGTLTAFYDRVPVGHVEAGLRTRDLDRPFPEELNRQIVSRIARYHFAPTESARRNLVEEGVSEDRIWVTGNTVIDALLETAAMPCRFAQPLSDILDSGRRVILVTAHRRESFGEPFQRICRALLEIARRHPECDLIYPVHLNPNVRRVAREFLERVPNIHLIRPLDYLAFVHLMNRSYLILTDSGGIQEEAPSLGKPVLLLRERTERPEALEAGTVRLIGFEEARIVAETQRLLQDAAYYESMSHAINPYGDGHASERIVPVLLSALREECSPTTAKSQ
jgi:UDP-N-acetylglucosamine 2-epimerase (non-hydrolysing)